MLLLPLFLYTGLAASLALNQSSEVPAALALTNGPRQSCTLPAGWDEDEFRSVDDAFPSQPGDPGEPPSRGVKEGEFCGYIVKTFSYPSVSELVGSNSSALAYGYTNCAFDFGEVSNDPNSYSPGFATEHILEWQLLPAFFAYMQEHKGSSMQDPFSDADDVDFATATCPYYVFLEQNDWMSVDGQIAGSPIAQFAFAWPGKKYHTEEWVILDKSVNLAKMLMWSTKSMKDQQKFDKQITEDPEGARKAIRDVMNAIQYHESVYVDKILKVQRERVAWHMRYCENKLDGRTFVIGGQTTRAYEEIDLADDWYAFTKSKADDANSKALAMMAYGIGNLKGNYSNDAVQKKLTDDLDAEIGRMAPWKNPFA